MYAIDTVHCEIPDAFGSVFICDATSPEVLGKWLWETMTKTQMHVNMSLSGDLRIRVHWRMDPIVKGIP